MDELLAGLDALAAEDLSPLFGPALLDRLRPLLAARNRLAAEVARTVRECEVSGAAEGDGLKSMPSWLRGHGHLSEVEAARVVRAARALEHLPGMAAAFTAGALTGGQAGLLARVAEPKALALALAAAQDVDLGVVDELLTGVAQESPHADTAEAVRHYLDRLGTDGPEPDPTEGRRPVIVKHADGSVSSRGERCRASGTTRRSTTGSRPSDDPTVDGAPGAPTAPRSRSAPSAPATPHHRCLTVPPDPTSAAPLPAVDRPLCGHRSAAGCPRPASTRRAPDSPSVSHRRPRRGWRPRARPAPAPGSSRSR